MRKKNVKKHNNQKNYDNIKNKVLNNIDIIRKPEIKNKVINNVDTRKPEIKNYSFKDIKKNTDKIKKNISKNKYDIKSFKSRPKKKFSIEETINNFSL